MQCTVTGSPGHHPAIDLAAFPRYNSCMEFCPHCGESVDERAESCPNCGSDFETGWLPDAEYYSLELPDDDDPFDEPEETPEPGKSLGYEDIAGIVGVILSAVLFLWTTSKHFPELVTVVCAVALGACFWIFLRWTQRGTFAKDSRIG